MNKVCVKRPVLAIMHVNADLMRDLLRNTHIYTGTQEHVVAVFYSITQLQDYNTHKVDTFNLLFHLHYVALYISFALRRDGLTFTAV